jgi:Transposase
MPKLRRIVIGGVDTHGRTHHAAVLDIQGRLLGDREFPAHRGGYRQLLGWLGRHGQVGVVGVEGTSSYGAGLTHYLLDQQVRVVEVDRPDRRTRRQRGRSDPIDAEAAARAVLAGTATAAPSAAMASWSRSGRCAPPPAARSRPAPRPSTSSRRCWSPHRPACEKRWTAAPPRPWSLSVPGCA